VLAGALGLLAAQSVAFGLLPNVAIAIAGFFESGMFTMLWNVVALVDRRIRLRLR